MLSAERSWTFVDGNSFYVMVMMSDSFFVTFKKSVQGLRWPWNLESSTIEELNE